jgi:hypothetical protein
MDGGFGPNCSTWNNLPFWATKNVINTYCLYQFEIVEENLGQVAGYALDTAVFAAMA